MTKALKIILPSALLIVIAAVVIIYNNTFSVSGFELREGEYQWELEYFSEEKYSELHKPISDADKAELSPLFEEIDKAFSFVCKTDEEAKARFGDILYVYTAHDENAAREEHKLSLLTGMVEGDEAVLWFSYQRIVYTAGGGIIGSIGSENIPSKVRLEARKQDGKWIVTKRTEHP